MTFIASVIARNGAAIIADSIVTSSQPVIEYNDFVKYFEKKTEETKDKTISLDPKDIISLFETKPHHTKDFEEKLFQFDNYTAITTAGAATINDKRIGEIIETIKTGNKKDRGYRSKKIETKIKDFCNLLKVEIKSHLEKKSTIRPTTFIFTNYNHNTNVTKVFKVDVKSSSKKDMEDPSYEFMVYKMTSDYEKVVCDGQNRISERILFGDFPSIFGLIPKIALKVANDFGIDTTKITKDYIESLRKDPNVVSPTMFSDMKIFRLSELSLQQAVDLAYLLMRVEIDFQNYTEDIPTVGGVIKLAVIDKDGFRYISGHEIVKPLNL